MTPKPKPEMQAIQHESSPYKYFTMMLNMAEDDLNPAEYRLLAHYVRWAGHGRSHQESVRQTAKVTRMGKTTIDKTRDKLEAKGYIKVTKPSEDERKIGVPTQVYIIDRWAENINRYAKGVPNQVHGVDPIEDTGVPSEVQGGVPNQVDSEEPKKEELSEEQNTNTSAPIGTGIEQSVVKSIPDAVEQAEKVVEAIGDNPIKPEPKPRPRNPIFDAVSKEIFEIDPLTVGKDGGRVGQISSWLEAKSEGTKRAGGKVGYISKPATPEHIKRFAQDYRTEHPGINIPLDFVKFVEAWRKWATALANKLQSPTQHPALQGVILVKG